MCQVAVEDLGWRPPSRRKRGGQRDAYRRSRAGQFAQSRRLWCSKLILLEADPGYALLRLGAAREPPKEHQTSKQRQAARRA
eukprot:gene2940-6945_t